MKNLLTYLACFSATALAIMSNAATFDWDARAGVLPDQLTPGMVLFNDSHPEVPMLQNGALIITNDATAEHIIYTSSDTNLMMPTNLVIEAEVRVLRVYDASGGRRTASYIQFTTSTNVGNMLWLDAGEIFISSGNFTHGPGAFVDTTDTFHTYRIEVDGTTVDSPVRVFQDGVLRITGSVYQATPDHVDPLIFFGDGSYYAWGGAEWRSFRHNAAAMSSSVHPRLDIGPPQTLTVHGLPGKSYDIQAATNLTETIWASVTNLAFTTNDFGSVQVPVGGFSKRFYRAVQW